jgi:hypothetical protein
MMDFPPVATGFYGMGCVAMVVVFGHMRRPSVSSESSAVSGIGIDWTPRSCVLDGRYTEVGEPPNGVDVRNG